MPRDQSAVLPATVQVRFAPYPCGTLSWADVPTTFELTTQLSNAGLDLGAGVPVTHTVRDFCHAIYSAKGGDPANKAALQSLTDQIGRDFWLWRSIAFDRVYNGAINPSLDALVDTVRWSYRADDCSTRLTSRPLGSEPVVLGHDDAADDCDARPKVYGGTDHAVVANGNLTLPKVAVYIEDGVLKWARLSPEQVAVCPSSSPSSMAMTTEDGDGTMTAD